MFFGVFLSIFDADEQNFILVTSSKKVKFWSLCPESPWFPASTVLGQNPALVPHLGRPAQSQPSVTSTQHPGAASKLPPLQHTTASASTATPLPPSVTTASPSHVSQNARTQAASTARSTWGSTPPISTCPCLTTL